MIDDRDATRAPTSQRIMQQPTSRASLDSNQRRRRSCDRDGRSAMAASYRAMMAPGSALSRNSRAPQEDDEDIQLRYEQGRFAACFRCILPIRMQCFSCSISLIDSPRDSRHMSSGGCACLRQPVQPCTPHEVHDHKYTLFVSWQLSAVSRSSKLPNFIKSPWHLKTVLSRTYGD